MSGPNFSPLLRLLFVQPPDPDIPKTHRIAVILQNQRPFGRGDTIPLKETLDLSDFTWLQFRRCFDKLESFCWVVGHTGEEVREILAFLETVY